MKALVFLAFLFLPSLAIAQQPITGDHLYLRQGQQAPPQQVMVGRFLVDRWGVIRPVRRGWWPTQWIGRGLSGRRVQWVPMQMQTRQQPQQPQVIGRIPIERGTVQPFFVPQ